VSENLEKSARERLFDEHIDSLVSKKKENFRRLLDECKAITLESKFKEIKKLIRDDPRYFFNFSFFKLLPHQYFCFLRYSKYSSSDRKCEKQFNEYMKDKMNIARGALKELLAETKKITDKSYQMAKEKVNWIFKC
jgi:transcription elongation regulator 1